MPTPLPAAARASKSRRVALILAAYGALLVTAWISGNDWLGALAALLLVSVLLSPGLRRGSAPAWLLWMAALASCAGLALYGHGRLAIDLMPVFVNAALCALFARTLGHGRRPLIARIIDAIEGRERLELRGVATYAKQLTRAWALLFAVQALVLLFVVACKVPDGLLAGFGIVPPLMLAGPVWGLYLHVGSYVCVVLFFVIEHAFRRRHLPHVPHASFPHFAASVARSWPTLVRRLADDAD